MQLARPAAPLGIRGGLRTAQTVGLHTLSESDGSRGAHRERTQQLLVVFTEHAPVLAAIEGRQHAHRLAAIDHRHQQRRLCIWHPELVWTLRADRAATPVIRSGRRCSSTCPDVESAIGRRVSVQLADAAGACLHYQLLALAQHDY